MWLKYTYRTGLLQSLIYKRDFHARFSFAIFMLDFQRDVLNFLKIFQYVSIRKSRTKVACDKEALQSYSSALNTRDNGTETNHQKSAEYVVTYNLKFYKRPPSRQFLRPNFFDLSVNIVSGLQKLLEAVRGQIFEVLSWPNLHSY